MMNFLKVIETVTSQLDTEGVRYSLIGGFAMALRGVQRSTIDLDFILMLEDLEKADDIFQKCGYTRAFRSENVSHYISDELELGRIDILHAFRGPTLGMIEQSDRIEVANGYTLPVVKIEGIIGLKVQALVNDPKRATSDWSDIRIMLETCSEADQIVDWDLLKDYLDLFQLGSKLPELRDWYGTTE